MVVLEELSKPTSGSKIGRYAYKMTRSSTKPGPSFLDSQITEGDCIVVSTENGQYALAIGFIQSIQSDEFVITTDRMLRGLPERMPNFDERMNQNYVGLTQLSQQCSCSQLRTEAIHQVRYRVDRDEMVSGMGLARFNLLNMFLKSSKPRLRELIVDLAPPLFDEKKSELDLLNGWLAGEDLNRDQRCAIERVAAGTFLHYLRLNFL